MPVNLNAGNAQETQTSFQDNSVGNDASIKTSNPISLKVGIQAMETIGLAQKWGIFAEKPCLVAPTLSILDAMDEKVALDLEMQQKLGVTSETVSMGKFMNLCLRKLAHMKISPKASGGAEKVSSGAVGNSEDLEDISSDSDIDLNKMNANDIEMLCLCLCQKSKSQMVKILKNILKAKIKEKLGLNKQYMEKQKKIDEEQAKMNQEIAKARESAIAKAVLTALFGVVAAALAVFTTIATAGAGTALVVCAVIGCVAAIGGSWVGVASAGVTIAALTTENKELAEKLNKANEALGWVGLTLSGACIIASIPNTLYNIARVAAGIAKVTTNMIQRGMEIASNVTQAAQGITEGSFAIAEGASNIRRAKLEKEMADIKIAMSKVEQVIEILSKFMDQLNDIMQQFIKNMLECEQMAGEESNRMSDSLNSLGNQISA